MGEIKKISRLTDEELNISKLLIFSKIKFIDEEIIDEEIWLEAEKLTSNIDEDDIDFIALTLFLRAKLWTGDKLLINGLRNIKFKQLLNTEEINDLHQKKFK